MSCLVLVVERTVPLPLLLMISKILTLQSRFGLMGYTHTYSYRSTRAAVEERLFFSLVYFSSSTAAPQLAVVG